MVNKPKAIGTWAETHVARFFVQQDIPDVEPRRTHGAYDLGDLVGIPDVVVEVKGGKAAERASHGQIREWLRETLVEQVNDGASMGLLVTKRAGYGAKRVGHWRAHMTVQAMAVLLDGSTVGDVASVACGSVPVSTDVHTAVDLLRQWLVRTGRL